MCNRLCKPLCKPCFETVAGFQDDSEAFNADIVFNQLFIVSTAAKVLKQAHRLCKSCFQSADHFQLDSDGDSNDPIVRTLFSVSC